MTSNSEKHRLSRLLKDAIEETSGGFRERWCIPGYTLFERLGAGTSGLVYRARRHQCQSLVALKVLRPEFGTGQTDGRMLVEMKALASLHHEGIARFIDGGTFDDEGEVRRFLALELIEGHPLTSYAKKNRLSTAEILKLLAQVADAIHYAHSQGVVHRDLKPSNVLVDAKGRAHVVDFGLARLTHAEHGNGPTMTGEVMGTPSFMSPEQSKDLSSAGPAGDIYSLGAVAYLLICGKPPHDVTGLPPHQAMAQIRKRVIPQLAHEQPSVSADQSTVIMTALAPAPQHRYPSAEAFANDLRSAADGQRIRARKPSALETLRRGAVRHKLAFATITLLTLTSVTAIVAWREAVQQSRRNASTERFIRSVFKEHILDQLAPGVASKERESLRTRLDKLINQQLATSSPGAALLWVKAKMLQIRGDDARLSARWDEATDLFQKAAAILQDLVRDEPQNPKRHADLSTALVRLGDVSKERSDYGAALRQYEEVLELDQSLVLRWPLEHRLLDNLSWSYERTAVVHGRLGNREEAARLHRLRHHTSKRLVAAQPKRALSHYSLCTSYMFMSTYTAEPEQKLRYATMAIPAADRACQLSAGNPDFLRYSVLAKINLLQTYAAIGKLEQARGYAADVTAAALKLTESWPEHLNAWIVRGQAHASVAKVLSYPWNECLAAEAAFQTALRDHPRHQGTRQELRAHLVSFEQGLREIGQTDQAKQITEKLVAHQRETVTLFPQDAEAALAFAELVLVPNSADYLPTPAVRAALETAMELPESRDPMLLLRACAIYERLGLSEEATRLRLVANDL